MKHLFYPCLFILISGLIAFTSCEYDSVKPETGNLPDTVSFTNDLIPIFNASCNMSGCHGTGNTPPDLTPANAYNALTSGGYVNIADPEASPLYTSMSTGSMKPFSKPSETALVLAWIKQGALNN